MRYSYSSVSTWWECPFKYKLRYIDKLQTKPDLRPDNALFEGTAVHEAIEHRDILKGIDSYKSNYPYIDINNEIEIFKMEKLMEKAIDQIPECAEYEHKLLTDSFVGYIDGLVKVDEGLYDLYDFKFTSGGASKYAKSMQIHVYKNFYERLTGNKIRDMYYVIVPKFTEKLNENLSEENLKDKFIKWLEKHDVQFVKVEYDPKQVSWFFARMNLLKKATSFEKRYSLTCRWCEYQKFCSTNGKDRSELLDESLKEIEVKEVELF